MGIRLFINGFFAGFRKVGMFVAECVNAVLLFIIYFLGVGMAALLVRLSKNNLLNLKKIKQRSHYVEKSVGDESIEEHYRQF